MTRLEQAIASIGLVGSLAGIIYVVEDRYQSADDFESRVQYTDNYHLEKEIERAQDKLEGLLLIPSDERRTWQNAEIIRLENLINKLIRQKT